ncbi:hypothetical protein EXU85_22455 [Spirosoma sp. KCTC 42546]|uniref:PH domain-containing protein n=1 Tax=Spirosoma sp. KCTC 42546 TaxID=2520506 RepID=UPI00115999F6|nr:PH domain-containing protein [Spirosoma sp. KCTC 42546]QDK83811.1 hypothetical protein EXU85_22455 [Spirosoma sp. KCTC 42546]
MITYKSKVGLELLMPLVIILGGVGAVNAYNENWPGLLILVLVGSFITHLFATTYYQIDGTRLRIKSGFLVNKSLDINTITKITETNNPLSSPATSMDRLELSYNKFDSILISPRDKIGFIQELKQVKPAIEVRLKDGKVL